jgi:hypothetical protein
MNIRPYRPSDRAALVAIHERQAVHDGLPYLFNDPADPAQEATIVATENGRLVGAATYRRIAEGRTYIDPNFGGRGSDGPVRRWDLLATLIRSGAKVAYNNGYTELMAATSPDWRGYGRRLVKELHFTQDLRARFYLDLAEQFRKERAWGQ